VGCNCPRSINPISPISSFCNEVLLNTPRSLPPTLALDAGSLHYNTARLKTLTSILCISHLRYACNMPRPSHPSSFSHPNDSQWETKITTSFIGTITAKKKTILYLHNFEKGNVYNLANYGTTQACAVNVPRCSLPNVAHIVFNVNLLKTKRNLLYIRNQSVPRSKHFPPRL
jgi:hypothetical protein